MDVEQDPKVFFKCGPPQWRYLFWPPFYLSKIPYHLEDNFWQRILPLCFPWEDLKVCSFSITEFEPLSKRNWESVCYPRAMLIPNYSGRWRDEELNSYFRSCTPLAIHVRLQKKIKRDWIQFLSYYNGFWTIMFMAKVQSINGFSFQLT